LIGEIKMNIKLIEIVKKHYCSGLSVKLISMERNPQMPAGLMGKFDYVDDAGQIHVIWDNGLSFALICGIDHFAAFDGPTTSEYLHSKLTLTEDAEIWYRNDLERHTPDTIESIDAESLIFEAEQFLEKRVKISQELNVLVHFPYKTDFILDEFISLHILSNEKAMELINKCKYDENESEAGICPKCGSDNIEYGASEVEETYIKYPWECNECSSTGTEYGNIIFDGHNVDYSPYFV
jgi:hypothetical protein